MRRHTKRRSMRRKTRRRSGGSACVRSIVEQGRQPSMEIMEWATTAGAPTPANMTGVAHGGRRRTHRRACRCRRCGRRRGGGCGCGQQRPF